METTLILSYIFIVLLLVGSKRLKLITATASELDYCDALDKSLLFFEAQRSGKLPPDQPVHWRGYSGLQDGFGQGVDLVGGYYDAGDHIKFGFPMAFAMTMLSWSVIEFEREIAACNQLEHAVDAIRWGTDYLIKAHTQSNTLWSQVGDGYSDHLCWERAEDMSTPRTAYKIDSEHPGSDIAGETAAAMAAASVAFRQYNFTYSEILISHAKQLFSFADTYGGHYDDSISDARDYYPSTGYDDELLWAAAWLFKATNEDYYMNYVVTKVASMDNNRLSVKEFSWDNKYAGLEVLLVTVLMNSGNEAYNQILNQLKANAEFFLCACIQKNGESNIAVTPGGLLYFNEWSNMQYVSSSAFLLSVYSGYLYAANSNINCPGGQMQPFEILQFTRFQVNYILGKNPNSMSYLVGYQRNFPVYVHHRGASIPSISVLAAPVGCFEGYNTWYWRKESNPNIIVGALVGGPNKKDEFSDHRFNYAHTEPTVAGNAPLVGLFARMDSLSRSSDNIFGKNNTSEGK